METEDKPQKLAILGGGMAALATAFELTSDPNWRDKFESITIHQMGWRLGGKCASSRGPCDRIEEHGIHGFLGSYYNTLPMMVACFDELKRKPSTRLDTFEKAIIRQDYGMLWELRGRTMSPWPQDFPTNTHNPWDKLPPRGGFEIAMVGVVETMWAMLFLNLPGGEALKKHYQKHIEHWSARAGKRLARKGEHRQVAAAYRFWRWMYPWTYKYFARHFTKLRRTFVLLDHLLTLVAGALADRVHELGYDHLDDEDFSHWLERHGAHPETIKSPVNLNFINMTYQYPQGDTSLPPAMAAGVYVHWALLSTSYFGSFIWRFAAGSGETLIAPLYEVLKKRGVRFEFFHKVEELHLSRDKTRVTSVDIDVQATLKDTETGYRPLKNVKGVPSWPARPRYGQLVEGDAMQKFEDDHREEFGDLDLESYWTPWRNNKPLKLRLGHDYDQLVFAISIGAVPHLCNRLMNASPAWKDMVKYLPALPTQAMQIWLNKSTLELGWDIKAKRVGDAIFSTTYLNPQNGQAELKDLIPYENWPETNTPKALWYFCGLMVFDDKCPPFTHHDYPKHQRARVKYQCIQYLQSGMGLLLPKASPDQNSPPGDPFGFDFDLLVDHRRKKDEGVQRFDCQFWRANIDPTERYVTSPPGSTKYRLKAWESGFDNLVLAGDWIYTGLNIGSVEGAVMGGRLAAHALTGRPTLGEIVGYEVVGQ